MSRCFILLFVYTRFIWQTFIFYLCVGDYGTNVGQTVSAEVTRTQPGRPLGAFYKISVIEFGQMGSIQMGFRISGDIYDEDLTLILYSSITITKLNI